MHLLPIDYYSPLPNTRELLPEIWATRWDGVPGFDLRLDGQLALLERLAAWATEIGDTPAEPAPVPHQYYFNNGNFGPLDAATYHGMVREHRPNLILEVGGGFSTMVAARAALLNRSTRVRVIEPFPSDVLRQGFPGLDTLVVRRLQDVAPEEFTSLEANDILFIDSTHVSKIDSDVNHLVLRILPRLSPGVFIHFHDVYLPWDYKESLLRERKRFWNEQYLVLAFLLFNDAFRVVWASHYLAEQVEDRVRRAFPFLPRYDGTSLWLQRVG